MHEQARVVIIGSGIAGSSVAYHLTELGWRDIVVLEQGTLIGGTTSHAPGLVGQLRSSVSLTKMLMYSVDLYKKLAIDGQPGYAGVGSLRLASSLERMEELKRQLGFARGVGPRCWTHGAWKARSTCPATALRARPFSPRPWQTRPANAVSPSTPTRPSQLSKWATGACRPSLHRKDGFARRSWWSRRASGRRV